MALHPKLNHWWHVPLYLSPRGLTTQAIPAGDILLDLEFDFIDHNLLVSNSNGQQKAINLYDGLSVAGFYQAVLGSLKQLGVDVTIVAKPYDPARVGSDIPFAKDNVHVRYDAAYVARFWQILRGYIRFSWSSEDVSLVRVLPCISSGILSTLPTHAFRDVKRPCKVVPLPTVRRTRTKS
jgi:hypothetical protein